ncbi:response regulator [Ramlibacter henchirensis]|nr:response regulator [Ramlibacter henchirensis]
MAGQVEERMEQLFVKVVGFSDVERHALNTLFRLSEERQTRYALWTPDCGATPDVALIDSDSHEALVEFELPSNEGVRMVWVGDRPPARAWRSFQRPIDWPAVIAAMDQLSMPPPDLELSLDLDFDFSVPPSQAPTEPGVRRALIANADRAERLYIRARMSLADLTLADEAETAGDALELARKHRYDVAVIDHALPGKSGGRELLRQLAQIDRRIPCLIVTKPRLSAAEKARSLLGRQPILLEKPVDPVRLTALLQSL